MSSPLLSILRRPAYWAITSVTFLLFFRPGPALQTYWGGFDDECYKAWALAFIGEPTTFCRSGSYLPGAGLLWVPSAVVAKAAKVFLGEPLLPWLTGGVAATSFLGWAIAWLLAAALLSSWRGKNRLAEALFFVLSAPALYYATSRTSLAHAAEFLLAGVATTMLARGRLGWGIFFGAWLVATRLNDLPFFFIVLGVLEERGRLKKVIDWTRTPVGLALMSAAAIASAAYFFDLTFVSGYNKVPLVWHLFRFRPERVVEVLGGSDWGLLWTAPFWLFCLAAGIWKWRFLPPSRRGAALWMATVLIFCCLWPTNGSDFGYRYLIGTYWGALLVWETVSREITVRRIGRALLVVNGAWLTVLTAVYLTGPYLRPQRHWLGWITPRFQKEALYAIQAGYAFPNAFWASALGTVALDLIREKDPSFLDTVIRRRPPIRPTLLNSSTGLALTLLLGSLTWAAADARRRRLGSGCA